MQSLPRSGIRIRLTRPLSIYILLVVGLLVAAGSSGCRQKTVRPVPPGAAVEEPAPVPETTGELCGECLELPDARVCTEQGELRNSCMAICTGELIVCNGSCPCPGESDDP